MATIGYVNLIDKFLGESSAKFYLTGSRFFGDCGRQSDYDFFTADLEETKEELRSQGFECLYGHNYEDTLTSNVYRYSSQEIQIDVQFVKDVELKLQAQELIKAMGIQNGSTSYMTRVWNNAFRYISGRSLAFPK